MSEAKRSTFMKRALIAVLAVALVFTMMPLSMGKVFADDAAQYQPALTITGPDGQVTTYTTRDDVINAFGEGTDTESFGANLTGIYVKRLLKNFPDDAIVTVQTQDDYTETLNANGKTVAELKNMKGILAYKEGDTFYDPTSDAVNEKGEKLYKGYFVLYVGKNESGKVLKDKWVNRITITAASTEPGEDPQPAEPVLTVVGDDLVTPLSFNTIDELKGDKVKEVPVVRDKTFHTKNAFGNEADPVVTGVTIESLINYAGIKDGKELDSLIINAKGGKSDASRTLTADQVLKQDLLGNKAMIIWKQDGKQVYKTAVGQFTEGEENNTYWLKADTLELKVVAKEKVAPVKPEPTKVANTLTVTPKNKTFKAKALKKKAKSYKALTVKNAKGAVTYTVKYKNKKAKKALKFNKKTGMIKVTKKTKKGTYKVTVTVKAAGKTIGDKIYLPKTVKKTITVKVK